MMGESLFFYVETLLPETLSPFSVSIFEIFMDGLINARLIFKNRTKNFMWGYMENVRIRSCALTHARSTGDGHRREEEGT